VAWWVEAPSVFGFYGLLYSIFRNWLWNKRFFRFLFRLRTPDWSGFYKGQLWTSHDNFSNPIPFELTILQSWNRIILTGKTATSTSNSYLGFFSEEDASTPFFIYQYVNQPNAGSVESLNMHKGVSEIHMEGDKIIGEFFNGRGRNTTGKYELTKQ
jgi:hypothetical protein